MAISHATAPPAPDTARYFPKGGPAVLWAHTLVLLIGTPKKRPLVVGDSQASVVCSCPDTLSLMNSDKCLKVLRVGSTTEF